MKRSFHSIALLAALFLGLAASAVAGAATARAAMKAPGEYQVKAVFLYNLARFVQWPSAGGEGDIFRIGIYGDDPFGDIIDQAVAGERLYGREVKVVRYSTAAELAGRPAEILFVGSSAIQEFAMIRRVIAGRPVLTVADTPGFLEIGGMVNLLKDQRQIELRISRRAAAMSDLFISSKLLRLATVVE